MFVGRKEFLDDLLVDRRASISVGVLSAIVSAIVILAGPLEAISADVGSVDPLLDEFLVPPDSARAETWWHWMGGEVKPLASRESAQQSMVKIAAVDVGYCLHLHSIKERAPNLAV